MLRVDANTPAPPIEYDSSKDTPPPSPPTRAAVQRTVSDFGVRTSVSNSQIEGETRLTRRTLQRSHTSPRSKRNNGRRGLAIDDIVNHLRAQTPAAPVFAANVCPNISESPNL